jgi:lipoprotein-releasing system permease protein
MIRLGIQFLFARPRQTVLMLLGFFFGTAAFVLLSGIMLGFRQYLVYQLVNNDAHVFIEPREEFLTDHALDAALYGRVFRHIFWSTPPSGRKDSAMVEAPQAWYERLARDPRVVAYTPHLTASVIFSKGKATVPSVLTGCIPAQQVRVTTIGDYVIEGDFSEIGAGGNRVVVGYDLARKLGVRLSQNVMVSLAAGPPAPFKVVAVFRTGNRLFDERAYGALTDVQAVNRTPNQVNVIAVRLANYRRAADVAAGWAAISDEHVQSWDQRSGNIFSVFRIQDAVRFLSIGAIMIVAGFGIYNVLNMTVLQKRRDIAILRSMGYTARDIVLLFVSQGLLLGLVGTVLGLSFGYAASFYLETIRIAAGQLGIGIDHLLVSREPAIYSQAALLALSSASIASILPAAGAGRLSPIEVIRSSVG